MEAVRLYILTRLSIDTKGSVTSRNVAATFDVFEAEVHRDRDAGNDFEVLNVSANWRDAAAQTGLIATMRSFTQMVRRMEEEALS